MWPLEILAKLYADALGCRWPIRRIKDPPPVADPGFPKGGANPKAGDPNLFFY